jgi:hypothetical protein
VLCLFCCLRCFVLVMAVVQLLTTLFSSTHSSCCSCDKRGRQTTTVDDGYAFVITMSGLKCKACSSIW